jgi:hypothetical protein
VKVSGEPERRFLVRTREKVSGETRVKVSGVKVSGEALVKPG